MTYCVVYIFKMANLQGTVNLISSGVQYALIIIFSSIMFFFVDKIGRRTLLVWGAIATGLLSLRCRGYLGSALRICTRYESFPHYSHESKFTNNS